MKEKIQKLLRLLSDGDFRFSYLVAKGFYRCLSDETFVKKQYKARVGERLNLKNPQTFNEKLQWLKLYDRKPEYTTMVDKYAVKQIVAEKIGDEYIIPTLGVWECFDDIDFDALPDRFVLKCTHDSGGLVIVRNKDELDKQAAKKKIEACLRTNYYDVGREWQYKDVPPRIIAEEYMQDADGSDYLTDYKIFCFHGEPKVILTVRGGHEDESKTRRRMYDVDWNKYEVGLYGKPVETVAEPRPARLEKMLELSRKLSEGMKHLRVDFYVVGDRIFFGELTFYHMNGMGKFSPESFNLLLGSFLKLEE